MAELFEIIAAWFTWEALVVVIGLAIVAFCLWTLHARTTTARRKRFEENIQAYEAERSRRLARAEQDEFATASFHHTGNAKSRA